MAQTRVPEQLLPARQTESASHIRRTFWFRGAMVDSSGAIMLKEENPDLSCAICEIRKEKRFCPAVHGRICPQCCGEQREVTLDCPSDCPYLQQARAA